MKVICVKIRVKIKFPVASGYLPFIGRKTAAEILLFVVNKTKVVKWKFGNEYFSV